MKSILIIFLAFLTILFSCKSENKKETSIPERGFVPYQQSEQTQQPIKKQQNIDPKVAEELIAVIKENLDATQAKDKERVLRTIHKDCPQRKSTIQGMDYVFKNYDMTYNLEKVEVLEVSGDEAKVYYEQTTRAAAGQEFQPMRSKGIHILRKENGKWKLFKTEYLGNEPIM